MLKTFKVNFPAVTICPRLILDDHQFDWELFGRQRFDRHTLEAVPYEFEEAAREFADERKFGNISYVEFLNRIENGSIKPEELGNKM